MRRACALMPRSIAAAALVLLAAGRAGAETDRCSGAASVSPCFDADPLWISTRPSPFVAVRSPRAVPAHALSLLLAGDADHRPVVLVTPSPHPEGQEIDAVRVTSTLLLGARYGIGHGIDAGIALPFVPYQTGAGTQSITDQQADPLSSVALRDPRIELGATLLGREPKSTFSVGSELDVGLPLGTSTALAGAPGPTVAPAFNADLALDPLRVGLDLGLRLVRAVSLGSAREGSSLFLGLGASVTLLDDPEIALGAEAFLRPTLAGRPAGAPSGTLDLPAEWLASARLDPVPEWSFVLAGGSGLPLSRSRDPGAESSAALGVTSPDFRFVATGRYTLPALF